MDLHDRAKGWAIQIREAHDEIERLRRTIHAQDDARVIELQNWLGWQCRNQGATKALVEGRAAVVPLPIMNSTMAGVAFTKYLSVKKMKGEGHRAHVSRAVHVAVTGMIDECRLDKPMENN
jgi:hypothetical protein